MKKLLMLLLLSLMLVATSCGKPPTPPWLEENRVSLSDDFEIVTFDDGNCADGICPPPEGY